MEVKTEILREPVAVIRPVYTDSGDGCEIMTDTGEIFNDRRSIKSVRRALARVHALDLPAQGAIVADLLGRRGVLPFYLDDSRVYIPFKMRKPVTPNDYSYGYVRLDQIKGVELIQGIPFINWGNEGCLEIASSLASARQNLEMGRRLAGMLKPQADEEELVLQAVRIILNWLKK